MLQQIQKMLKDLGVRQFVSEPSAHFCGQYYTTLTSSGIHAEAQPDMMYALSAEEAVAAYCEVLQQFLGGELRTKIQKEDGDVGAYSTVIWRRPPTLEAHVNKYIYGKNQTVYTVYSRLLGLTEESMKEI